MDRFSVVISPLYVSEKESGVSLQLRDSGDDVTIYVMFFDKLVPSVVITGCELRATVRNMGQSCSLNWAFFVRKTSGVTSEMLKKCFCL